MEALYPFFISFIIIFLAELGDKTQLLVLSFTSKSKIRNILFGIAIGSFLSHGIAIIFGSKLGLFKNELLLHTFKLLTYITFLGIGIFGFIPKKNCTLEHESTVLKKISNSSLNYVFIVALCIMIGELGDKTLLASLGLGVEYPYYKLSLILGCMLGMIVSNFIAILFGKILEKYFSDKFTLFLSNIIFIIFGLIGILYEL